MDSKHHSDLERLYLETFPETARMLASRGCDADTAKDLFQDALIIYLERTSQTGFRLNSTPGAYIKGIAWRLWHQHLRTGRVMVELNERFDEISDTTDHVEQELTATVLRQLQHTGKKCLDLLQSFYYEQIPMTAVRDRFQFGSVRSATVQKYKCLEKLRASVKKHLGYEKAS
ncbi:MAG: sigma-70 family RNA polymerase sigma factor [Sphingobacteriales bacterium]|nr:MAG: sigma-70 family RNA polymerase sigma factor [Sphingobacteriales bacterium]